MNPAPSGCRTPGDVGVPRPAQDRHVLATRVHDHLDRGVGQHARERGGVGRIVVERVDDLGAHAVGRVGVGHRHLRQAQLRLVAALGHELRVDRYTSVGAALSVGSAGHGGTSIGRWLGMRRRGWLTLLTAGGLGAPGAGGADVAVPARGIGHSAQGRPIRALRIGARARAVSCWWSARSTATSSPGRAVLARLRRARPRAACSSWLVDDVNPDGAAAEHRQNARGVDLNRNFPFALAPAERRFYTGPGPRRPEPETRAAAASSSGCARASTL